MMQYCKICHEKSEIWGVVDGFNFFKCLGCGTIILDNKIIEEIDNGFSIRKYDSEYWSDELTAANERAWGSSIARVAESILYTRRPIERYIDIGSGSGELLESLSYYLPNSKNIFYGVEMFPPVEHTKNPNYFVGGISDVGLNFDAGCCIEVVEHLTPLQLEKLFSDLSKFSNSGALYIFNTGLADWVDKNNRCYIDPCKRGHIVSYSLKAMQILSKKFGFVIYEIKGKEWAFVAEFEPVSNVDVVITDRIWTPLQKNKNILNDKLSGSLTYILGIESARAYL